MRQADAVAMAIELRRGDELRHSVMEAGSVAQGPHDRPECRMVAPNLNGVLERKEVRERRRGVPSSEFEDWGGEGPLKVGHRPRERLIARDRLALLRFSP